MLRVLISRTVILWVLPESVRALDPMPDGNERKMNALRFSTIASAAVLTLSIAAGGTPTPARADTASTAAIAAGAAAIVGTLLYDSSRRPYYVRGGHRYYVTQDQARYYQGHRRGVARRAYAPARGHEVAREANHGRPGDGGRDHR